MITAREIAAVFGKRAQQLADGWLVPCPVPSHGKGRGDRSPSLRISDGESSRLLVYCFAGCDRCAAGLRRERSRSCRSFQ